jgi:hypothetical protein
MSLVTTLVAIAVAVSLGTGLVRELVDRPTVTMWETQQAFTLGTISRQECIQQAGVVQPSRVSTSGLTEYECLLSP